MFHLRPLVAGRIDPGISRSRRLEVFARPPNKAPVGYHFWGEKREAAIPGRGPPVPGIHPAEGEFACDDGGLLCEDRLRFS